MHPVPAAIDREVARLKLAALHVEIDDLTPEQAAFLERLNPCFRERHVESGRPGELLSADTFMVGTLKGIGRVYLHAVAAGVIFPRSAV